MSVRPAAVAGTWYPGTRLALAREVDGFVAAVPEGYDPDGSAVTAAKRAAVQMGGTVELVRDPKEAAEGADVLYTDVWTSMGQEEEAERRRSDLAAYRIDDALLSEATPDAIVLHCLPAHYGEAPSRRSGTRPKTACTRRRR